MGVQGQPGPHDNEAVLQREFDDTTNEQNKPGTGSADKVFTMRV